LIKLKNYKHDEHGAGIPFEELAKMVIVNKKQKFKHDELKAAIKKITAEDIE